MMGELDYIDFLDADDYFDAGLNPPRDVRCRDCLSDDVYWHQNNEGRWVLYDVRSSRRHRCDKAVLTENRMDAFSELDD